MTAHSGGERQPQPDRRAQTLSQLGHDIRQCLYVLRTGHELMRQVREDQAQFDEICGLMQTEERKATQLVDEILDVARGTLETES